MSPRPDSSGSDDAGLASRVVCWTLILAGATVTARSSRLTVDDFGIERAAHLAPPSPLLRSFAGLVVAVGLRTSPHQSPRRWQCDRGQCEFDQVSDDEGDESELHRFDGAHLKVVGQPHHAE